MTTITAIAASMAKAASTAIDALLARQPMPVRGLDGHFLWYVG